MEQYWITTIEEALDETGVKATSDQIKCIADICTTSHEVCAEYFGRHLTSGTQDGANNERMKQYEDRIKELEDDLHKRSLADIKRLGAGGWSSEVEYMNGEARWK